MAFHYDSTLYNKNSAKEVLPFVLKCFKPKSVIDVGCGTGTWLSTASQLGIRNIFGIDNSLFDPANFQIPESAYQQVNLEQTTNLSLKFDLCFCLEVGEHLKESASNNLVQLLCNLAPVVLFSAAVPGQPGQAHINCQWPAYWQDKFAVHGFLAHDILRKAFWDNEKVEWWYKQNMVIYAKAGILPIENEMSVTRNVPALIHPSLYQIKIDSIQELQLIKERSIFHPSFSFALRTLVKSILVTPWQKK